MPLLTELGGSVRGWLQICRTYGASNVTVFIASLPEKY
jgi:hypothetical protein